MNKILYQVCFLTIVVSAVSPLQAEVLLFDYNLQENWGTSYPLTLSTPFDFSLGYVEAGIIPVPVLFWSASGEDVGSTFSIYKSTDPEHFVEMASLLTNGINDEIYFEGGSGTSRYDFMLSDGTTDFAGYDISRFSLVVHDISISQDQGLYWVDSNVSFQAWAIPEPAALLLLGLGGVLMRKRKQHPQAGS